MMENDAYLTITSLGEGVYKEKGSKFYGFAFPVKDEVAVKHHIHVRRAKVPEIPTPPGSNITTFLKRFTYPPDEIGSNPNTPSNPNTDVPQWFEN